MAKGFEGQIYVCNKSRPRMKQSSV